MSDSLLSAPPEERFSIPRLGIEGQIKRWEPWDGHDFNALESILFDHALTEIQCDHDTSRDRAICACSLVDLGWWKSVCLARQSWVDHVMAVIRGGWSTDAILRRAEGEFHV